MIFDHTCQCWQIFGGTEYAEFENAAHDIEVPSENAAWIIVFDDDFVDLTRFQINRLINMISIVNWRSIGFFITQRFVQCFRYNATFVDERLDGKSE